MNDNSVLEIMVDCDDTDTLYVYSLLGTLSYHVQCLIPI